MTQDAYLQPYRESAETHGTDFEVTLWANRKSQRLRFEVFAQMCDMTGKRVLDAGCSRGDMAAFLIDRGVQFERMIGVDGLESVIEYARTRELPRCEFLVGDFVIDPKLLETGDPQVICISGSLNTMKEDHLLKVIESAWQAAGEILLFNFLSDRTDSGAVEQQYPAIRHNTLKLLDWALARTTAVKFRQDYFPGGHDATILMSKQ